MSQNKRNNYLIVDKRILPDYYEKVLAAQEMLRTGAVKEVSEAARQAGISRSTYYKYKDFILEPTDIAGGRKAVLSMMLTHEQGVLSSLLTAISQVGCSVLTITQSLPIRGKASVTMSLDVSNMSGTLTELLQNIEGTSGVEQARLVAVE